MDRETVGTGLLLVGVVLLATTLSVSAVLAPDISSQPATDGSQQTPNGSQPTASDSQQATNGSQPATGADQVRATLVGSQGGGVGWHKYGSVYRLRGHDTVWTEDSVDSYFDVTQLDNGTVIAGFMRSGYENCGPYDSPCTRTGFRVIAPGSPPEIVSELSFPVRTTGNSEAHDVELLPGGEVLLADMEHERIVTVADGEIT